MSKVNREFRNSLKAAYDQNIVKNQSYFQCVQWLEHVLSCCDCEYAMLKGAYLCRRYPCGYRTSNDIDLLVLPTDVTKIGSVLLKEDFRQGYVRNDIFVPATRMDIVASKMMRGETVPYIKCVNLPGLKWLEVDINFSLDYKNGDTDVLQFLLNNATKAEEQELEVTTLSKSDFFLHLCCHLYKEATTLPWIEMKRDMSLYKYCDIYMLLEGMSFEDGDELYERACHLGLEKICAFAINQTAELFAVKNQHIIKIFENVLKDEPNFTHLVTDPSNKRKLIYVETDLVKRFFCESRSSLLVEVV